ncbi:MAG: aminoglycoside phosphotransferase family protein, partial [Anaerolineae bacterium]|nr:aminoglycoside phosphotransferase family protein [Anaerolineae bacterium]
VRVQPRIWNPLYDGEADPENLMRHTLVIKYGPTEDIHLERQNYENLPSATRDFFVRIPEASYTDPDSGLAFVIMQDLRDYKTLYEMHESVSQQVSQVADQLGNFLERMHEGGSSQVRPAPRSLIRDIYLSRMLDHIDRIFDFLWEYHFYELHTAAKDIQYELFSRLGQLITYQRELESFPAAYMHGDLHMRNIMITGLERSNTHRHTGLVFKLIDLEYLRRDGDAAFDAGELLIDIELNLREEFKHQQSQELLRLRDTLDHTYREFARRRGDDLFGVRTELAKARALLRIAKGKTKRGGKYADNGQHSQAERIASEIINHAKDALQYLQAVNSAIH